MIYPESTACATSKQKIRVEQIFKEKSLNHKPPTHPRTLSAQTVNRTVCGCGLTFPDGPFGTNFATAKFGWQNFYPSNITLLGTE